VPASNLNNLPSRKEIEYEKRSTSKVGGTIARLAQAPAPGVALIQINKGDK